MLEKSHPSAQAACWGTAHAWPGAVAAVTHYAARRVPWLQHNLVKASRGAVQYKDPDWDLCMRVPMQHHFISSVTETMSGSGSCSCRCVCSIERCDADVQRCSYLLSPPACQCHLLLRGSAVPLQTQRGGPGLCGTRHSCKTPTHSLAACPCNRQPHSTPSEAATAHCANPANLALMLQLLRISARH